ncbi:hypothetical protein G6F16_001906 [Rhizopus arrhizus]|uniref:Tc1-like transposase DDE domain-containing protein n=1 Tax=Rhizopus oryzae TaxID=64495 RepID=A0A9P7BNQ9_RHIOR|nr:hypothetical protein G6F23_011222 [Rhizopus arrhizus]KAG0766860.1 hypothetical protein G6F24_003274 [Rhizopus arrhizus]KAG0786402.1 hypothetical protein G6F22_007639 [Rhizopus arrhizus]KAG0796258.1 hypothetical protein G6F21_001449 [Rhizopus arrhizus]KAG0807563.1 hypothetical protein G6F20_010267 [Rhizopus arrhizus]
MEKNGGTILPGYKPASEVKRKGNNVKLTEEHSQNLDAFIEKHPTCIVKDATESLCETFQGLTINESTVYRHITEKLEFTLTRTQARFWFKKNMVRPVARSKKGETAEVDVEAEGTNLSILGCMSAYGLIALSQQVPKSSRKKQKPPLGTKRALPHETNSSHFVLFVEEIVSVLNKIGLKNMYIVMDNASIHKTPEVLKAIRDSGHYALFLPLYSPMLNPIEEC